MPSTFVKFCPDEAAAGAGKTAAGEFSGCCSAELFAQIGYEAATMTAITEPRRSWRSAAGQLSRHALVAPHTGDGKFDAELGSIVWIVLSP